MWVPEGRTWFWNRHKSTRQQRGKKASQFQGIFHIENTPIDTNTSCRQHLLFISLWVEWKVLLGTCSWRPTFTTEEFKRKHQQNRLEKCIKGICYNDIKLTIYPHIYGGDVKGINTQDTPLEVSSDWQICWLAWFGRPKPDFATLTPVSTQSCDEKPDVTQFIVDSYTHV